MLKKESKMLIKTIKTIDLKRMRIFLRADLNVPLKEKKIIQDCRLKALLPTIDYIQENGGKVILATHIGRPDAQSKNNFFDENLSTQLLTSWFEKKGYAIDYEVDLLEAKEKSYHDFSRILLLENLRFFNGEKKQSDKFAQLLADLADIYINDAFGLIHRNDTSTTLLAQQFLPENKACGLLVEKEITALSPLKENPAQPFIIVVGGNKITDKCPLLEHFFTSSSRPQKILIGGATALPFLQAQNLCLDVKPDVDKKTVATAKNLLEQALEVGIEIHLPQDIMTVEEPQSESINIQKVTQALSSPQHSVDIGPETIKHFQKIIAQAQTIFVNGTMGIYENPTYAQGSKEILTAIAQSSAYSVVGGGDSVAAVHLFNLQEKFDYISTGGGATLAFLAEENPLEHFEALKALR